MYGKLIINQEEECNWAADPLAAFENSCNSKANWVPTWYSGTFTLLMNPKMIGIQNPKMMRGRNGTVPTYLRRHFIQPSLLFQGILRGDEGGAGHGPVGGLHRGRHGAP